MIVEAPPLLEMRDIGKSFAGVRALNGVSLTLRAGQVAALLGENGAGKSTLINVLSGVFPHYEGQIFIDGKLANINTPAQAQVLGISTIHQELNLVPDMSVEDNIWLGRERAAGGWIRKGRTSTTATQLLERVGLDISPRRMVRACRLAEQQLVEVAKALSLDARILIMDEPTSALADSEVQRLFKVVASLTEQGIGVIYISHRLEELDEVADTVSVMRDGNLIGERTIGQVTREELIHMMVGRPVSEYNARPGERSTLTDEPRLRVENLSLRGDARTARAELRDVSFTVAPGEILGLGGLMGAGRSEVLLSIFGAYPPSMLSGTVTCDGKPFAHRTPQAAIKRGIALVAEDRKDQNLILDQSVRFNSTLAALRHYAAAGWWVLPGRERAATVEQVENLGTKTPGIDTPAKELSGGNQQKVVLAKWLLTSPGLILLDEPTRGIDVGAKAEIHALVAHLAEQGVSFLVVSSELPELLAMSDRILVICEGAISAEFDAATATQQNVLTAAMPSSRPDATREKVIA